MKTLDVVLRRLQLFIHTDKLLSVRHISLLHAFFILHTLVTVALDSVGLKVMHVGQHHLLQRHLTVVQLTLSITSHRAHQVLVLYMICQ